ncbi:MAG: threonine--tRNA ligase, partial [Nanoarchaeota archaeon]
RSKYEVDGARLEIQHLLDFIKYVLVDVFKFEYVANLSTRPEKAMGDDLLWRKAEEALAGALTRAGMKYVVKPGEGAFYGPKIDFEVKDALGRMWQLSTIQLDFQMPLRMEATYEGQDGSKHNPVMIHRAILGSLERFMGVLIEHYAGRFPLWLTPEQVRVVTISDKSEAWGKDAMLLLKQAGIRATYDGRNETLNKKIREAELDKINYICVVGEKEAQTKTVNVRGRDAKSQITLSIGDFVKQLKDEISKKA